MGNESERIICDALQSLVSSTGLGWKVIANDAHNHYLLTTEKPLCIAVDGIFSGWRSSIIRKELNTSFLHSLPRDIRSHYLATIAYEHGDSPEHRRFGLTSSLHDKVILLDSSEARSIRGYKPNGCDQKTWDEGLFDEKALPFRSGFIFASNGLSQDAISSITNWAQETMADDSWPDWILYRDAGFFNQHEAYGTLAIPNGIHPVICVDTKPDEEIGVDNRDVEIGVFLQEGADLTQDGTDSIDTRAKESWLKSEGLIRQDETLVGTAMYTQFLSEYQKHNMPTIPKPRSIQDEAGWNAYRKAVDEIEDPLLKESIRYCGNGLSVYDFDVPF